MKLLPLVLSLLILFPIAYLNANEAPTIKTSSDKATVYIVRTSNFASLLKIKYFVNEQFVGACIKAKYLKIELDTGKHVIWGASENKSFMNANLEAGKSYIINAKPTIGAILAGVKLEVIDESDEKKFKKAIKILKSKKQKKYSKEELEIEASYHKECIAKGAQLYKSRTRNNAEFLILNTPIENLAF